MKISVISVGKIKEKYFVKLIEEHKNSISKTIPIDLIEVPDEKCPEKLSDKEMIQVKDLEGERILAKIPDQSIIFVLAIDGKQMSTEELKKKLKQYNDQQICFIIGGSLGLSDSVIKKAHVKLSFSNMTFPHQMMKVMLMEQIDESIKHIY
ncbi:MAG: 23S rRNA (pseudouridine(1915)-N(3))-methyltransferase RlmH [Clostridia bacterium]|nr:23S rRNA (pseudouridine(1915)-N(3))-methyltransferase RlmH [Clostridia bacterium]